MNFNQLIHPEIVMQKRGDENSKKLYRNILSQIKFVNPGFEIPDLLTNTCDFNLCSLPVTFINWAWKRPMAKHTVSGHFKWQVCGPKLQLRKLIWIDSYEKGEEVL